MNTKLMHKEAMQHSFEAKQAMEYGDFSKGFELYNTAAALESQVAKFYFEKPELEPTRSVMIRSAAFLNLKAGRITDAKQFIFFGLLNIKDELILDQLNNALELAVSLASLSETEASREFSYLNLLRQRSVHYIIEPTNPVFGKSVTLEMIRDFSIDFLKSLKAYASSKFRNLDDKIEEIENSIKNEIDKIINPLITSSSYGSFKFSIANDFLSRSDENKELLKLKANVIEKYHVEIFTNPLSDDDINIIKKDFSSEEINEIFKPLARINGVNSTYRVGYFDSNDFRKKFPKRIINKQRRQLFTIKPLSDEEIGELENSITHNRSSSDGRIHKTTIFRQQMKSAELNMPTNQIEPTDQAPVILSEEIILDISFNSSSGFTFSYPDFRIEHTDIHFNKALKGFYDKFYGKLTNLKNMESIPDEYQEDLEAANKLIGNLHRL